MAIPTKQERELFSSVAGMVLGEKLIAKIERRSPSAICVSILPAKPREGLSALPQMVRVTKFFTDRVNGSARHSSLRLRIAEIDEMIAALELARAMTAHPNRVHDGQ